MPEPTLREQLVRLRQESGVSQADLAERLGVTQTAVSYWETGQRQPGLDDVERWASALGASPTLLQGSPTAGSNPFAGDLVGRLTTALLAEPWTSSPRAAHGEHQFDSGCAICQGDVDRLAAFVARFLADGGQATRKESFPVGGLRDRIAAAMIADLRAVRPDAAPDEEEDRAAYELTDAVLPVVEAEVAARSAAAGSNWQERAEQAEARLAELESAITWETSCTSCARVLDSSYADHVRAEQTEAKLQRLRDDLPNLEQAAQRIAATDSRAALREFAECVRAALDQPEGTDHV